MINNHKVEESAKPVLPIIPSDTELSGAGDLNNESTALIQIKSNQTTATM